MELQELQKKIGSEIKKLRVMNNWTQEEAAEKLHLCRKSYGEIERGETDIHLSRLVQIANFYEVDVDYFVDGKEKNVFYVTGTSNSQSNKHCCNQYHAQPVEEKTVEHELEKSALLLKERDKENENLKKQIALLEENNALLKKNQ